MNSLNSDERRLLGGIQHAVGGARRKSGRGLCRLLLAHRFNEESGSYVPLSDRLKLARKLTDFESVPADVDPSDGTHLLYFANPLLLPKGYGSPQFEIEKADMPTVRTTNGGFLIITFEFDPDKVDHFQEMLSWTQNGTLTSISDALCRFSDYRGFNVTFSAGKSLHFHFIFSTKHLKSVPFDAKWSQRLERQDVEAAIMANIHQEYWDRTFEIFERLAAPSIPTDRALRNITQWRRFPWGNRLHEETSKLFEFPPGILVPQIVILEKFLSRAPNGSTKPMLSPDHDLRRPVRPERKRAAPTGLPETNAYALIDELQGLCKSEWGEYPKPVKIDLSSKTIYFKNGPRDRNPSSVVHGNYRRILVYGKNDFQQSFYLPGGLTAEKLLAHLALRFGLRTELPKIATEPTPCSPMTSFQRLKEQSRLNIGLSHTEVWARGKQRSLPITTVTADPMDLRPLYRRKLHEAIREVRGFGTDYLIISGEGAGKTSAHFSLLATEAMDIASKTGRGQTFNCVATRSNHQAAEKAAELSNAPDAGRLADGMHLQSFWSHHYCKACRENGASPIPRGGFDSLKPHQCYEQIKSKQPDVYRALERERASLWEDHAYSGPNTILCTSNATIRTWQQNMMTRAWYHPDFCPEDHSQDLSELRKTFKLSSVVYDEAEYDEFVHIISAQLYNQIGCMQRDYPDWSDTRYSVKVQIYAAHRNDLPVLFEQFDELMRIDLERLTRVQVNYDAIPFGRGRRDRNVYALRHGQSYYVGFKDWVRSPGFRLAFLTTERLPAAIIEAAYRHCKRNLIALILCDMRGIYPVKVPHRVDPRAKADGISELARGLLAGDCNAVVIGNNLGDLERTINFQNMKGQNDLSSKNLSIVPTMLAPDHYADLNVLGQWLGISDIIELYYEDLICQAVGRNKGFRDRGATVQVFSGNQLSSQLRSRMSGSSRVELYVP
ncbi:hypothetical protein [Bradyrhizobium iriomotense]|uniref:hypothetical protein n=1 Tax=Bradyrhizobium iriomotense TaxID=441950 RepID=UPI001B8A6914|nr:hypothetical protein [Bradyrhizobium iriomotense]MBR0783936.1 hypothetical protein [Bradyrhizobium iriomotense]